MGLLGLELSDAGIMAAGGEPARLLIIEGQGFESPGFALAEKDRLTVGRAAERKAHLYPRQVLNRFWDQLNTEPLEQSNPYAQNHAEIAYEHLARIWEAVKHHGNEMVIAVPGFFNRDHLGLILGITSELSIPVKGFVSLAVAAASNRLPDGLLLHLDIHLHRFEVTRLKREKHLIQKDSISAEGSGLSKLYKDWVNAIAEEFVRSTRFDPFHQAATEQELYNRLPGILSQLRQRPSIVFEMKGGSKTYHVTLTRDFFLQKSEPVFREISRLIDRLQEQYGKEEPGMILQLTDRIAHLPGLKERLAGIDRAQIIELEPGTGALEVIRFRNQISEQQPGGGAPFLTTRPLPSADRAYVYVPQPQPGIEQRPTHILYRNLAYRITKLPLFIGRESTADGSGIRIQGEIAGVSRKHCSVQLRGKDVILNDYSTSGTFVDEKQVTESAILELGQIVRVGTHGEELKLIGCVETDET
jgi:hypothetical protein